MKRLPAALLAASFLLPTGALAQNVPRGPAEPATAAPSSPSPQGKTAALGPQEEKMVLQRVNQRIAGLHAKLHITSAEESQWHQFADAMHAGARQMAQKLAEREQNFRSMNAVENMQSYAGIAEQHAKNMENLVPAFQNLYNSLSAEQKRTADQLWRSYAERARRRR